MLQLIEPVVELKSEFLAMVKEFCASGEEHVHGIGCIEAADFEDSVQRVRKEVRGIDLLEGRVPASTFWLVLDGVVIGTCHLRHTLNDFLENYGGHIGYSVRPSHRNKGYGTHMLGLALEKAKDLGIRRVLVTCDDDNPASARVIEKNGGKLADVVKTEYAEFPVRRYWITLEQGANHGSD